MKLLLVKISFGLFGWRYCLVEFLFEIWLLKLSFRYIFGNDVRFKYFWYWFCYHTNSLCSHRKLAKIQNVKHFQSNGNFKIESLMQIPMPNIEMIHCLFCACCLLH